MKKLIWLFCFLFSFSVLNAQIKLTRTGGTSAYTITNAGDNWTLELDGANLKLADTLVYVTKPSDDFSSIVSNLNGVQRYVIVNKPISCIGATTTPTGIDFIFTPSGMFTNNDSLTFKGRVIAPRTRIFPNNFYGLKIRLMKNEEVFPEWWGAFPNDGSDDSATLYRALRGVSTDYGTVMLNQGTYSIQLGPLNIPSNTKLKGTHVTRIDSASMYNGTHIYIEDQNGLALGSHTEISNIHFTVSSSVTTPQDFIRVIDDSMITIKNCTFIGTQTTGSAIAINVNPGKYIYIKDNVFVNTSKAGQPTIDIVNASTSHLLEVFEITGNHFLDPGPGSSIRLKGTNAGPKCQFINIKNNHFRALDVLVIPNFIDVDANQVIIHNNSFRSFNISEVIGIFIRNGQGMSITSNTFDLLDLAVDFENGSYITFANNVLDSCDAADALAGFSATKVNIVNNVLTPSPKKLISAPPESWFVWGNQDGQKSAVSYEDLYLSNSDSSELHWTWGTHTGFTIGYDRNQDSLYIRYDNQTYTDPGYDIFTIDHQGSGLFQSYFNFPVQSTEFKTPLLSVQETTGGNLSVSILSDDVHPEGSKPAPQGSIYLRRGETLLEKGLFFKESGSGVIGWDNLYEDFQTKKVIIENSNGLEGSIYFDKETQDATHIRYLLGHEAGNDIDFLLRSYDGSATDDEITVEADNDVVLFGNNKLGIGTTTPTDKVTITNGNLKIDTGHIALYDTSSSLTTKILAGQGHPEGAISADKGSVYLRTDGSAGEILFVKESGSGVLGWSARTHVAAYGSLEGTSLSETLSMTQNVWAQITDVTNTLLSRSSTYSNVTVSSDKMTLTKAGDYRWTLHVSFTGNAGDIYEITISHNSTKQKATVLATSSTSDVSMSASGFITAAANDVVYPVIRNVANNNNATANVVFLTVTRM